ncbi:MAG: hypothetical protein QW658_01415, partial [Candidatus Bathyarchaeia archaeon]
GFLEQLDLSDTSQPKCVKKVMAITSTFCLSMRSIESVLSRPPNKGLLLLVSFLLRSLVPSYSPQSDEDSESPGSAKT